MRSAFLSLSVLGITFLFTQPALGQRDDDIDAIWLAPWAFGDSINAGGATLTFRSIFDPITKPEPKLDVPLGGGTARLRITDSNKALPQDRFYFSYNLFKNAFNVEPGADSSLTARSFDVSRYTIGFEKTIFGGLASIETRVPITGTYSFFSDDFGVSGSNAGDIGVISKLLVTRTERFSMVVGIGLNLPTGADVTGNIRNIGYRIQNEALHLVPYLGLLYAPDETRFIHFFMSGDYALTGSPVFAGGFGQGNNVIGKLNNQELLSFDISAGRWFFRNVMNDGITGLAAVIELHYVTTASDADRFATIADGTTLLEFGNSRNRSDVLNLTAGLHLEVNRNASFRVGAAVPLRTEPDRDFDAEVIAQFVYRFGANASSSGAMRGASSYAQTDRQSYGDYCQQCIGPFQPWQDVAPVAYTSPSQRPAPIVGSW